MYSNQINKYYSQDFRDISQEFTLKFVGNVGTFTGTHNKSPDRCLSYSNKQSNQYFINRNHVKIFAANSLTRHLKIMPSVSWSVVLSEPSSTVSSHPYSRREFYMASSAWSFTFCSKTCRKM